MTAYTNVPKPTGANYTNINTAKPTYDESTIIYDDPLIYYDGIDPFVYVNVTKPTGAAVTVLVGMTMGLLMPLTNAVERTSGSPYTNIPKPT